MPVALPIWKRFLDIGCCMLAMPALTVAVLMAGALMLCTSRGPLFYTQVRVGYRGRHFRIYKLRTMHVSADPGPHQAHFAELVQSRIPMRKMDGECDRRLIPGGWLMRASGMDELPQVINVLRGEMSIVGPRPCIPYEYVQYSAHQKKRFEAVPGITGLWQVSGKNRTTFDEMIALDVAYANGISPWADLKIIGLTIPALLRQIYETKIARRSVKAPQLSPSPVAVRQNRSTATFQT